MCFIVGVEWVWKKFVCFLFKWFLFGGLWWYIVWICIFILKIGYRCWNFWNDCLVLWGCFLGFGLVVLYVDGWGWNCFWVGKFVGFERRDDREDWCCIRKIMYYLFKRKNNICIVRRIKVESGFCLYFGDGVWVYYVRWVNFFIRFLFSLGVCLYDERFLVRKRF